MKKRESIKEAVTIKIINGQIVTSNGLKIPKAAAKKLLTQILETV